MRSVRVPDRSDVTDETPLLLDIAARLAFPDGSVSGLALKSAASREELVVERIAGRLYTTLAAIREMRIKCRRIPKARGSGSSGETSGPTDGAGLAPGPSRTTEESGSALASALLVAENLLRQHKTPSRATSSSGAKSLATSNVTPMPLRSPTS